MRKIKEFKPSYIVNLDDIEVLDDIAVVFALAKQDAGLALTDNELVDIIDSAIKFATPKFYICECKCESEKKQPWYKRFWKKLKYAFPWPKK